MRKKQIVFIKFILHRDHVDAYIHTHTSCFNEILTSRSRQLHGGISGNEILRFPL